jgi:hypothetical protein
MNFDQTIGLAIAMSIIGGMAWLLKQERRAFRVLAKYLAAVLIGAQFLAYAYSTGYADGGMDEWRLSTRLYADDANQNRKALLAAIPKVVDSPKIQIASDYLENAAFPLNIVKDEPVLDPIPTWLWSLWLLVAFGVGAQVLVDVTLARFPGHEPRSSAQQEEGHKDE